MNGLDNKKCISAVFSTMASLAPPPPPPPQRKSLVTGLSFIVWFTESVDRQISSMCGWACVTRILCAKHENASWVFSLGDFVLESLFCAQRLWILNLFSADTEIWASRFDWLKHDNFRTFQMLFISSQTPVTSARELYRLLPAIMLSLFSLSQWLLTAFHSTWMSNS